MPTSIPFLPDEPIELDPDVAERAAKVRARWDSTITFLRAHGVTSIKDRRLTPKSEAKRIRLASRYEIPEVHVFGVDRYRFGMGPWRAGAWKI